MFGNPSQPSKIYSYGLCARRPPAPAELIDDQMFAAHRYRNALCELELARRRSIEEIIRAASPDLAANERDISYAENELGELRQQIGRRNARAGKKTASESERLQ